MKHLLEVKMNQINGGIEIDLRDFYFILKKKIWLILTLFLLSTIISGIVSFYYITPGYSTYSTLMLGQYSDYGETRSIEYNDVRLNQALIGTYAKIATSRRVLDEVQEELSFDISMKSLNEKLDISLLNDTEIIKVTVEGTSPEEITEIANTLAEVFSRQVAEIMAIDNVQILDDAELPEEPVSPNKKLNILIAGVLAIMVAVFIILLLEMFDNTIKIPEDVERQLDLPVLGMIPEHE